MFVVLLLLKTVSLLWGKP